ncbi:MAG: site-specific integrase, partial [Deltaproteobacteria bacterium]|nr:site-specific integrase [Deltaproteobacteria bacterium]
MHSFNENIDHFLEFIRVDKGLSQSTLEAYSRDIRRFTQFLEKKKISFETLTALHLLDYFSELQKEGLQVRSRSRAQVSLRQLYRFLMQEGRVQQDPTENLDMPKLGRKLPEYLSMDEVDRLLLAPALDTSIGLRDKAMLELIYATGLRVSELVG